MRRNIMIWKEIQHAPQQSLAIERTATATNEYGVPYRNIILQSSRQSSRTNEDRQLRLLTPRRKPTQTVNAKREQKEQSDLNPRNREKTLTM